MEKKLLPYLVILSAISVSLSAAYYSVTGIGHMFSGEKLNVMLMMSTLEISKLVLASLVYQYWDKLALMLKAYYISAILVLMVITSGGIYGYLSGAYSKTGESLRIQNIELSNRERKIKSMEDKLISIDDKRDYNLGRISVKENEKSGLNNRLSTQNQSIDRQTGQLLNTSISNSERRGLDNNIRSIENEISDIESKLTILDSERDLIIDSISKWNSEIDSIKINSDISSEMGPLIYLSEITGRSMDVVINWFIILLMIVFDPLAVSLVIGANIIFKNRSEESGSISMGLDSKLTEDIKEKQLNLSELDEKKIELDQSIKNTELELSKKVDEIKKLEESIDDLKNRENEKIENILNLNQKLLNISKEFENVKGGESGESVGGVTNDKPDNKPNNDKPINKKMAMRK